MEASRDLIERGIDFTIGEASVKRRAPLEYAIDRADGLHCAEMTTAQVVIGRGSKRPQRMPDALRDASLSAKGVEGTPSLR